MSFNSMTFNSIQFNPRQQNLYPGTQLQQPPSPRTYCTVLLYCVNTSMWHSANNFMVTNILYGWPLGSSKSCRKQHRHGLPRGSLSQKLIVFQPILFIPAMFYLVGGFMHKSQVWRSPRSSSGPESPLCGFCTRVWSQMILNPLAFKVTKVKLW